jgi:hypothetical protein
VCRITPVMRRLSVAVAVAAVALLVAGCGGSRHANPSMRPGGILASGSCGSVHWDRRAHRETIRHFECSDYHPVPVGKRAAAAPYAYELPIDPAHPKRKQWSTFVRTHPVRVGYVVRGIFPRDWIVVAVHPIPLDGQEAAVRGWRGRMNPVWHGRLVLQQVFDGAPYSGRKQPKT